MKTGVQLLLIFILSILTHVAGAQSIDIEAVGKYWELTDGLRKGQPLTDSAWNSFIALEGNKTYCESEFTPAMLASYRRAIEIVYRPQNDSLLKKCLQQEIWYVILAKRYKDEEPALKKYLSDTIRQPGYFRQGYAYVYEYLPASARHPLPDLRLYYNCLSNDAVSYPNGLFFSLLSCVENKKSRAGTLEAHELHHRMRPAMDIGDAHSLARGIASSDTGLIWAISAIPNEGIADMIDKSWELAMPGDPSGIGEWLLTPAPAALKTLDSVISAPSFGDAGRAPSRKYYRQLLQGTVGHMPGFYMARIITANGYKKQMINTSANPFSFFFLYDRAAGKDPGHPFHFSATTMARLKTLEKKYKTRSIIHGD